MRRFWHRRWRKCRRIADAEYAPVAVE